MDKFSDPIIVNSYFLNMSAYIKYLILSFCKYRILSLFWISCFIIPTQSFSHGSHYSEKEIKTALSVFEKAILLSPEFIKQANTSSVIPFYKINGHKIYLTDGFWSLTRAWLKIYIQELEKRCPCDLDPNFMIQTAKAHAPRGFFERAADKIADKTKNGSYTVVRLTAKYGYLAAVLKLSSEAAETILSVFMGMKGAHLFCNAIDLTIVPLARLYQKYIRVLSYGRKLSSSSLIFALRMAWLSRQIRKSKNKVFFIMEEALNFNTENLERVNQKGPKEHRHLWLNEFKQKTDPLFEEISRLEEEYYNLENKLRIAEKDSVNENEIEQQRRKLIKQIEKLRNKANRLSQVNRKSFFGNRFKRYLFLKSRKNHRTYMMGHHLSDRILGKKTLWPLALQENILEQVLDSKTKTFSLETEPDEIQKALAEEFLTKRHTDAEAEALFKGEKQVVYSLLESIEQIFDTTKDIKTRMMTSQSIESALTVLFGQYLQMSLSILGQRYDLSYKDLIKLHWLFGRFSHSVYDFSDFLSSVSIAKNKDKIKFYKYESMEKLLAFLDYLYEVQILLTKTQLGKEDLFSKLQIRRQNLMSLSLLREKKSAVSFIPFKKAQVKCKKLVEK